MRLIALFALLLTLVGPAFAAGHEETRHVFKDWLAACRDDGYCSATAYVNPGANGTVADYVFRVGRQAEQPDWEVSFTSIATMADEFEDFTLTIDDDSQGFAGASEVGAYGSVNEFYFLGHSIQRMFGLMVPGHTLKVDFTDDDGKAQSATFSLSGLAAALTWIDDQQQRVGSQRIASDPPHGLTPTGEDRDGNGTVPVALLDRLRADPECTAIEQLPNSREITIVKLDDDHTMYMLPCWAAAYNFGSKVFVESSGEFQGAYFPEFLPGTGWIASSTLVNAGYDEDAKVIVSFNKGRGFGDCGDSGQWSWKDHNFILDNYRYKQCTDGESTDGGAEDDDSNQDWPIVYQSSDDK
ncbi:MAG TPA: DUF1176 domain-containing protein [Devosiaceae bacterium]|jgi:hypothetical protein